MSYDYATQKKEVLTDAGQKLFLQIRDRVQDLLEEGGAFRLHEATRECTGNSWDMLACIDRLVELGEIEEVGQGRDVMTQYRVFVHKGG